MHPRLPLQETIETPDGGQLPGDRPAADVTPRRQVTEERPNVLTFDIPPGPATGSVVFVQEVSELREIPAVGPNGVVGELSLVPQVAEVAPDRFVRLHASDTVEIDAIQEASAGIGVRSAAQSRIAPSARRAKAWRRSGLLRIRSPSGSTRPKFAFIG